MPTVSVKKDEYLRLKKLERSFGQVFEYFLYLQNIREARKQVQLGKTVSQNKLFEKLHL